MSPKTSTLLACLALAAAACFQQAAAHGGSLHPWVFGDAGHNDLRYPLARCPASAFSVIPANAGVKFIPAAIPVFNRDPTPKLTLSGSIDVWIYLSGNCTNGVTSNLLTMLTVKNRASGLPYANRSMYAYGMNAPCANTSTMDLYRNNDTLGDNRFNLMWVNAGVSDASGLFRGSAVNSFRTYGPRDERRPKNLLYSLIFVPDPSAGPMMCCDLKWNPPVPSKFFQQGQKCATIEH